MPIADNILKNFNLVVDGRGFAGNIKEFQPPELSIKSSEFRAGGMDAPVDIDTGMEKLTCSFIVSKSCRDTMALFGVTEGGNVQLTARGALESFDGTVTPVKIQMTGKVMKVSEGAWKPGEESTHTYTLTLSYYKREQDNQVVHEIDVPNMIRKINGTDQLQAQRTAMGV